MRLALYEPDIPQNTGALLRLGACLGTPVDVIEPCGFVLTDQRLRRAVMDYIGQVDWHRHTSWSAYLSARREKAGGRLVLLSTRGRLRHIDMSYRSDDTFLLGRESAGVPAEVWHECDSSVRVPLTAGTRSLNIVTAAAIVLAEALRQTNGFSEVPEPSCPDPSCPDPSCPDPSCPDPSCPDPSCPDPSCPDPSCPDPSCPDPSCPDPS